MIHAYSSYDAVLRKDYQRAGLGILLATATLLGACGGGGGGSAASGGDTSATPVSTQGSDGSSATTSPLNITCASGYGNDSLIRAPSLNVRPTLYEVSNLSADKSVDTEIIANVTFTTDNGEKGLSSPLRLELWAVPQGGTVGATGISGHLIFRTQMTTVGGSGPNRDQMESDSHVTAHLAGKGTNPPAGDYCYVVALQMVYSDSLRQCNTSDNYCPRGWYMFKEGRRVQ